jgi:hypothetical protein
VRRLAHLSDLHFGRINPAAVDGLLRSLEDARPDLVIVSGDFTQAARTEEFMAARAFLDRLPAPTFAVPGNHDLPPWNPIERLLRPYERYRRFIAEELEPFWSDAKVGIVGMKSPRRLAHNLNSDCPSDAFATATSPAGSRVGQWQGAASPPCSGVAVAGAGTPIPGMAVAGGGTGKGTGIVG